MEFTDETEDNPEFAYEKRAQFGDWVDTVVHYQSGGDHTLQRFVLRFDLNVSNKSRIDQWIGFALAKQVKVLELDFNVCCFYDLEHTPRLPYPLGHRIFRDASASSSWHGGCRYLEQLSLSRVHVKGELIEQLLVHCPVLERLVLLEVCTLTRLKIIGQSLKLKYLCIELCCDLQCVEIYDTNLVSLIYTPHRKLTPFFFYKVPQLSELSTEFSYLEDQPMTMSQFSNLSHLENLQLPFFDPLLVTEGIHQPRKKLTSVKKLKLSVMAYGDESLLPLTHVIQACPSLQSLVLELSDPMELLYRKRKLKRVVGSPHRYLKEIEFSNYCGRSCDLKIVRYLIDNAVALEKLVVNPCEEEYDHGMKKVTEPRQRTLQQLKGQGKLFSKIDLVIN